jgi:hypothetical protein
MVFFLISDYPVVILSDREQKPVCLGEDVDLVCSVDSNPLSNLSWHNQTGIIEGLMQTIYCSNVDTAYIPLNRLILLF